MLYYYGLTELWQIYTILALRSIGNTFYTPALQATIPLLAPKEQFMRIAAIDQLIQAVGNAAGPALGALFVLWFDMVVIANFDVLRAVIACCLLAFVRIPRTTYPQQDSPKIIRELKEGLQILAHHKGIAMLIYLSALFYFIFMPTNTLYPLLVFNHFKGGAVEMGIIEFVFGMCMILGGTLREIWTLPIRKVVLINTAYLGYGHIPGHIRFTSGNRDRSVCHPLRTIRILCPLAKQPVNGTDPIGH